MARMKYVHDPAVVARLWVAREQDSARTKTGTFYFDGPIIYSYGWHFPIARHVWKKDEHCVLFTTDTWPSGTTSRHCREVRSALKYRNWDDRELPVFRVPYLHGSDELRYIDDNLQWFHNQLSFAVLRLLKRRLRENRLWDARDAANYVSEGNAYAAWFERPGGLKLPDVNSGEGKPQGADLPLLVAQAAAEQHRYAVGMPKPENLTECCMIADRLEEDGYQKQSDEVRRALAFSRA